MELVASSVGLRAAGEVPRRRNEGGSQQAANGGNVGIVFAPRTTRYRRIELC